MMDVFPADRGLSPVKELRGQTFTGSFPDWIDDASDGGTVDARDAGTEGGFWQLSPDGDEARIETAFPIDPAAYDVLELASRLRTTEEDTTALVGLENDDGSIVYGFQADGRSIDDRVRASAGGDHVEFDARRIDGGYEHEVVLRWDVTGARVELGVDGTLAAAGDVDILDPGRGVHAFWRATGPSGELRVHSAVIRYRETHNHA